MTSSSSSSLCRAPGALTEDMTEGMTNAVTTLKNVQLEWHAFQDALPHRFTDPEPDKPVRNLPVFPHPCTPGGLPDGWSIRWSQTDATGSARVVESFVVQRGGGWMLLFHHPYLLGGASGESEATVMTTTLWSRTALSVAALYRAAVTTRDEDPDLGRPEGDLRRFILSSYNMTDETEAAEAILVGLGAPITVFPKTFR